MTRVIRANPADHATRQARPRCSTRIIRQSQQKDLLATEQIIANAKKQAEQILEQSRTHAISLQEQIAKEATERATKTLVAAKKQVRQLLQRTEDEFIFLSVRIAEKILGRQLELKPGIVNEVVAQCLKMAQTSHQILIRVNPDDLPLVEKELPKLREYDDSLLVLKGDQTISRGGCVLDTEEGQIDGQLESQLKAIAAGLETATDR
ncbi:MAG: FliH/SctL family protein [Pseudomonadota bacterium]